MGLVPGKEVGLTELAWEDEGAHGGLMNRRSNVACLSEREIEEYLFNRLSGVTREVIEEHLLACRRCLDRVESEEQYQQAMRMAARTCEEQSLERSFSGSKGRGRSRVWGWTRLKFWTVALASMIVMSTAVFWQNRAVGRRQAQEVFLELQRGAFVAAEARAGTPLHLTMSTVELPDGAYRAELVDAEGRMVEQTQSNASAGQLVWRLEKELGAGRYWIRLRQGGGAGEVVREYGLKLAP